MRLCSQHIVFFCLFCYNQDIINRARREERKENNMRTIKRRLLPLLLALTLCLGLLPTAALAADDMTGVYTGTAGAGVTWHYDGETKTLTVSGSGCIAAAHSWKCDNGDGVINGIVKEQSKHLIIEEGITSMEKLTFMNFRSLETVDFPSSLRTIGEAAFYGCGELTNFTIPDGVTTIERRAFQLCRSITSVTFPVSVTSIGDSAFDCFIGVGSSTPQTFYYEGTKAQWAQVYRHDTPSSSVLSRIMIQCSDGEATFFRIRGEGGSSGGTTNPCANGHSYDGGVVTKPATCTANGTKTYTCTVCGKTKTESVARLEHSYDGGVVTKQPTADAQGIRTYTCTLCGQTKTESIPKLDAPAVTFTDVPAWFTTEVGWAAANGITNGYGDGTFGTDDDCTNPQILTFLWRAAGEQPAKAKSPFTVQSYYQEAVDWAYGEGIIDASFNAYGYCTRASAMEYIWKAFGRQSAAASSFVDVPASAPYAAAVNWGVSRGLTKGYGNNDFRPGNICSRGEIAAFLYRAYN